MRTTNGSGRIVWHNLKVILRCGRDWLKTSGSFLRAKQVLLPSGFAPCCCRNTDARDLRISIRLPNSGLKLDLPSTQAPSLQNHNSITIPPPTSFRSTTAPANPTAPTLNSSAASPTPSARGPCTSCAEGERLCIPSAPSSKVSVKSP